MVINSHIYYICSNRRCDFCQTVVGRNFLQYLNQTLVKPQSNVQNTVQQIQSNIDKIASQTKNLKNGERFTKIQKMNNLRQIASTLEDLDQSVNTLIDKQSKSKSANT